MYMGKVYKDMGKTNEAIVYFKKADDLVTRTSDVFPVVREIYETLIDYYKERKNIKNQLKYVKRLLAIDSLLSINYTYLSKKIDKKNDSRKLTHQKEELLKKHKSHKIKIIKIIIWLTVIVGLVTTFIYYSYRK